MENRIEKPIAFLDIAGIVKTLTAENNELVAAPGHWTDECRQKPRSESYGDSTKPLYPACVRP